MVLPVEFLALCLGRRLTEFCNQRRHNGLAILRGDAFAQALKFCLDAPPQATLLGWYPRGALSEASQVGDVPLAWFAVDADAFHKHGTPMRVAG